MVRLKALFPFIRYHFAYAIRPANKKKYDYIGETKSWTVVENTSPYKDTDEYFNDKGTFEDWLNKQKAKGKEQTDYAKSIISGHKRYPWATLSQLRYKPRPSEKKVSEAKKLLVDEDDLFWKLRAVCDELLVARSKGNNKAFERWLKAVTLEELEGLSKQRIDRLDKNDVLNVVKKLMYFEDRGEDEYVDIEGNLRRGRIYHDKDFNEWVSKLSFDKRKRLEQRFKK